MKWLVDGDGYLIGPVDDERVVSVPPPDVPDGYQARWQNGAWVLEPIEEPELPGS